MMSRKYRAEKFKGIERWVIKFMTCVAITQSFHLPYVFRADSLTWNPHKLMGTLLQCSTLHLRENVSALLMTYLKEDPRASSF